MSKARSKSQARNLGPLGESLGQTDPEDERIGNQQPESQEEVKSGDWAMYEENKYLLELTYHQRKELRSSISPGSRWLKG